MITKEQQNNKEAIETDELLFMSYVNVNSKDPIRFNDICDFITLDYENLNTFEYNLNKLRGLIK